MKKMNKIKSKYRRAMSEISLYIELTLALFLTVAIIVMFIKLIGVGLDDLVNDTLELEYYLNYALSLAIGLEFVKMLCSHTPNTIIEVLMFAIARHMIVEHLTANQMLAGVLAIGGLFVVRRFLCDDEEGEEPLSMLDR